VEQVQALHAIGLLHFDLKPRNILLFEDGSVVLCDLDASMRLGVSRGRDEKRGSSAYYAPEVARWAEDRSVVVLIASEALDVWSLGALLFELCNGCTLFRQGRQGITTPYHVSPNPIIKPLTKHCRYLERRSRRRQ